MCSKCWPSVMAVFNFVVSLCVYCIILVVWFLDCAFVISFTLV